MENGKWYNKAAPHLEDAKLSYGELLISHKKDLMKGIECIEQVASSSGLSPTAEKRIGTVLVNQGFKNVSPTYCKKYFFRTAKTGDSDSMYYYGRCCWAEGDYKTTMLFYKYLTKKTHEASIRLCVSNVTAFRFVNKDKKTKLLNIDLNS